MIYHRDTESTENMVQEGMELRSKCAANCSLY